MHSSRLLVSLFILTCIFVAYDAKSTRNRKLQQLTIRGRVTYTSNLQIPAAEGAQLTVALQDISLADAPAKVIAKTSRKAVRFPMPFTITYLPSQVSQGATYSLSVTIRNRKNELLYTNDVNVLVVPLGTGRTKTVNVPVIRVKPSPTVSNKKSWPELVGKDGQMAVNIIKKESGLTNVVLVKEGSAVTADYRLDRVRVLVNAKGIVIMSPTIG